MNVVEDAHRPAARRGRRRKWTPVGQVPVLSQHSTSDRSKSRLPPHTERGNGQAHVLIQRRIIHNGTPTISPAGIVDGRGASPGRTSTASTAIRVEVSRDLRAASCPISAGRLETPSIEGGCPRANRPPCCRRGRVPFEEHACDRDSVSSSLPRTHEADPWGTSSRCASTEMTL